MRDLVVREGLETMANEASERLRALVEAGEEVPYEVREAGDGSPLCRYEPLTERFVHAHATELSSLDSFGVASAALESTGLAAAYLDQMGVAVPQDPRERAELAGVVFLCRLWTQSTDFSLDRERLDLAIDEVEAGTEVPLGEIEVIVPLRGLQMPTSRLELDGVTIVRADTVDVPAEAQAGELHGASPWEPAFLAVVRAPDPEAGESETAESDSGAVEAFRRLVTTLRLHKSGGVGLGPHAWTRIAGDRWRRIATGAGRPRPGGYRLAEEELAPLVALSRALASPSTPFGRRNAERPGFPSTLGRAITRFEAGLERNVVIEALNDLLLSLRFVLEGGGPASLGLSMRVAALCAEPDRRGDVKAIVDRAIGLERELWSGEPAPSAGGMTPAETAIELEELVRAILKDAACGHLGSDLRVAADEILLADGLAVGEGTGEQRGATAEWDVRDAESGDEQALSEELEQLGAIVDGEPGEGSPLNARISEEADEEIAAEPEMPAAEAGEQEQMRFIARAEQSPEPAEPHAPPLEAVAPTRPEEAGREPDAGLSPVVQLIEQTRAERAARQGRVADLFPRPETTEWNVREIAYDRTRRAQLRSQAQTRAS
jgi:hypothetical protein